MVKQIFQNTSTQMTVTFKRPLHGYVERIYTNVVPMSNVVLASSLFLSACLSLIIYFSARNLRRFHVHKYIKRNNFLKLSHHFTRNTRTSCLYYIRPSGLKYLLKSVCFNIPHPISRPVRYCYMLYAFRCFKNIVNFAENNMPQWVLKLYNSEFSFLRVSEIV